MPAFGPYPVVNRLPLSGIAQTGGVDFEGKSDKFDADWRSAPPGYFEAIGIPLERGRLFTASDRADSRPVGLIDAQMARKAFGGEDPIGKRFRISAGSIRTPWTVYWPETQRTQDRGALVVRTAGHPASCSSAILEQIHAENPEQPVYDIRPMEQWLGRTLQSRNLLTGLVGLLGGASLLLACVGLYGVVSYTAGLRLREFGIRLALGADPGNVRGLVLGHAGRLALLGTALGLALAWPVGRAIRSLLFSVSSSDPVSWAVAPIVLILVALVAAFAPAARAARTDPAVTLRAE